MVDHDESPAETGPASIPWRSPMLHLILGTSLMAVMGISLLSPALPTIRDALAITETQTGLVLTVFSLPTIVLAPVAGVLTDRLGRRRVLVPALLVYGVAGGSVALTEGYGVVLALRAAQGVASSGLLTLSLTLITDHFEGPQRDAVMGVNVGVSVIGVAVYPLLGGALAGVAWNAPFAVYVLGLPLAGYAWYHLVEPTIERDAVWVAYLREAATRVLTRRGLLLLGTVLAVFLLFVGALNTSVPFLLSDEYALAPFWIGVILSAPLWASAAASLGIGRLAGWLSADQRIGLGFVGYGVGLAGVWFTASPATTAASLMALGVGHGLVVPSADTAISRLTTERTRGGIMSLRLSMKKIGQTVGPVLFTTVGTAVGYAPLLLVSGLLAGAVGLVAVGWATRRSGA